MKKILLLSPFLIFMGSISFGQYYSSATINTNTKSKPLEASENRFFAALTAGPSFPVGVFSNKDFLTSTESGLARVGYNVNTNVGYRASSNLGVASSIFYSRYKVDQAAIDQFNAKTTSSGSASVSADHWQYAGIVVGPMATIPIVNKLFVDFKVMAGYARANMPVVKVIEDGSSQVLDYSKERWADAFAWQLGSNLRYNFASKFCFFTNLDYNHMKPKWVDPGYSTVMQKTSVIDFNIGLGANF